MEDWGEKVPVHVVFAEVIVEEFGTSGQVDGQATQMREQWGHCPAGEVEDLETKQRSKER